MQRSQERLLQTFDQQLTVENVHPLRLHNIFASPHRGCSALASNMNSKETAGLDASFVSLADGMFWRNTNPRKRPTYITANSQQKSRLCRASLPWSVLDVVEDLVLPRLCTDGLWQVVAQAGSTPLPSELLHWSGRSVVRHKAISHKFVEELPAQA